MPGFSAQCTRCTSASRFSSSVLKRSTRRWMFGRSKPWTKTFAFCMWRRSTISSRTCGDAVVVRAADLVTRGLSEAGRLYHEHVLSAQHGLHGLFLAGTEGFEAELLVGNLFDVGSLGARHPPSLGHVRGHLASAHLSARDAVG